MHSQRPGLSVREQTGAQRGGVKGRHAPGGRARRRQATRLGRQQPQRRRRRRPRARRRRAAAPASPATTAHRGAFLPRACWEHTCAAVALACPRGHWELQQQACRAPVACAHPPAAAYGGRQGARPTAPNHAEMPAKHACVLRQSDCTASRGPGRATRLAVTSLAPPPANAAQYASGAARATAPATRAGLRVRARRRPPCARATGCGHRRAQRQSESRQATEGARGRAGARVQPAEQRVGVHPLAAAGAPAEDLRPGGRAQRAAAAAARPRRARLRQVRHAAQPAPDMTFFPIACFQRQYQALLAIIADFLFTLTPWYAATHSKPPRRGCLQRRDAPTPGADRAADSPPYRRPQARSATARREAAQRTWRRPSRAGGAAASRLRGARSTGAWRRARGRRRAPRPARSSAAAPTPPPTPAARRPGACSWSPSG